jgi:hypothetical protein
VDADEEAYASPVDDGSTQNVEDSGHSTRECEDWTAYFGPVRYDNGKVKYDNCETNAIASEVSEAKTALQYVTKS